ncbi:MAG TPA: hypothetical protein PKB13_02675 [Clostridia bacterium]|nr:hypothetical protein [Clostridia bacterium]
MPASNYVKQGSLNFWLRNQGVTQPSQVYVALFSTNPTAAGTGVEISGGGYARQLASFAAPTISGDVAILQNSAAITYPQLTANAGTAAYVALFDALAGGNLLFYEALPTSVALTQGFTPYWAAGELKVTQK